MKKEKNNSLKQNTSDEKIAELYSEQIVEPVVPVGVPLEEPQAKHDSSGMTLKQFERKQKQELKMQKEREKQLQLLDSKEANDPTEEKYTKITKYTPTPKKGLSVEEVESRRAEGLTNVIKNKYSKSYASIILGNLFTFFNLLCVICVVALIVVKAKITDFLFVVVYIINLTIGIIQEIRSKITVEKLSLVKAPTSKVVRNGETIEIASRELVLSDVVVLTIGNQIPCDGTVLSGEIEVNESLLTGESVPVKKVAGDKLFGGSFISSGNCAMRIDRIGDDCYVQRLSAKAKKFKKSPSQLLNAMNTIIKVIGLVIIPVATLITLVNYDAFNSSALTQYEVFRQVIPKTASVVIGMIPSGMFLLTSMALAVGVIRLSKHHTLVQDMYALEMLARIDVLCLDKTGTITDGHMKVSEVVALEPTPVSIADIVSSMQNALRDNNMTSIALNEYFNISSSLVPKKVLSFSSDKKYSAVTFIDNGTYVLGAPDFVIKKLSTKIKTIISQYTMRGERVLLLAHSKSEIDGDSAPAELKAIALIVLTDNIRPDAIKTIRWFKENGVNVKVISGDDPVTVAEIAKRAGVEHSESFVSLEGLNNKQVYDIASRYTVFGRVTPEQKAILIKSLKAQGHTVAMTGDGVNDILAMKESDCSITVATGSDATRNISHLVLMDNNFNSMPEVVSQGRRVINNIQKSSSLYLMKTLFTFIFALISIFSQKAYPFTTGEMIALEFLVIGMGSFFLSLQPNNERVKGSFIHTVFSNALPGSLILVFNVYALRVITDHIGLPVPPDIEKTMQVFLISFGGMVYLYRVCEPMNVYRSVMYASILTLMLLWAMFGLKYFDLKSMRPLKETWQYVLIVVCMIQFNFPLIRMITGILQKIKIRPEDDFN